MYYWRKLTEEQRKKVLAERRGRKLPWHSPPHLDFHGYVTFIITAACYEHAHVIGKTPERMSELEQELLLACESVGAKIYAWCILPNHYHILVRTDNIKSLRKAIGKVHGKTAMFWNREDGGSKLKLEL